MDENHDSAHFALMMTYTVGGFILIWVGVAFGAPLSMALGFTFMVMALFHRTRIKGF